MARATANRIIIQTANQMGDVTRKEALAGEAGIGPGDLLEFDLGTPDTDIVLRHNGAADVLSPKMVALPSQTPDDEDNFSINVDYANGDLVYYAVLKPGDRVNAFLAVGQTATDGILLQSDGDGALNTLAAVAAGTLEGSVFGRAIGAVNNAAGAAPARIIVEVQ